MSTNYEYKICTGSLNWMETSMWLTFVEWIFTWSCKPTDTELIMNLHASKTIQKIFVDQGFVNRVHRACSSSEHFHESKEKV